MRRADRFVLIVDDYGTMRRILRNLLSQIGFVHVDEADDGHSALEKLRERNFDLVISDWQMEPMSGLDLLKAVRADARFRHWYARVQRPRPHLKIEFRPIRVELQNSRNENSGDAAQSGLRIVWVRDDQTARMREHTFGDALDIFGVTIGFGDDHADQADGVEGVIQAGPDRGAPAQIRGVAEDYDARQFRGAIEDITKIGAAAIVHYHDVGQGPRCKGANEIQQTVGGPIRRDDHG